MNEVVTGTYQFKRSVYKLPSCPHETLQLNNSDKFVPIFTCTKCLSQWALATLDYKVPPIVQAVVCTLCKQLWVSPQEDCALHQLRDAGFACANGQGDKWLIRAALVFAAASLVDARVQGEAMVKQVLLNAAGALMRFMESGN